jgi:hypothetical protein
MASSLRLTSPLFKRDLPELGTGAAFPGGCLTASCYRRSLNGQHDACEASACHPQERSLVNWLVRGSPLTSLPTLWGGPHEPSIRIEGSYMLFVALLMIRSTITNSCTDYFSNFPYFSGIALSGTPRTVSSRRKTHSDRA